MRQFPAHPLAVFAIAALAACGGDGGSETAADGRVSVVASFYPLAEAASAIGGDLVQVDNLTPAGTEPHDLELSPRQVDQLQDGDVVLYLGHGFQPAIEAIAERRDSGAVDLLAELPLEDGAVAADDHRARSHHDDDVEGGDAVDPHFWLDPTLMAKAVDHVEAALVDASSEHADTFAANADRYRQRLSGLDADFEAGLADCERRTVVVSHSAFHYLTKRYDLEQHALAGLSPETEPSPARLAELTDLIADEGVTTVFYETLATPDVAETLAREAGVDTAVLNPLEGLTETDIEAGKDYEAVMRDNLAALRTALGCD